MKEKQKIIEISGLSVTFEQYDPHSLGRVNLPVISDLNVSVHAGEIVAVVGSSGSGKSLLAHAIFDLLPANAKVGGNIYYLGEEMRRERIRELRGREIALIPQGTGALNPLMKTGRQITNGRKDDACVGEMRNLMRQYGLPRNVEKKYPFELSGGMARRVLLLTALMSHPKLIVADEPTPGMEESLAGQGLADFRNYADQGNGVLLITHDLRAALGVADRIAVFYAGTTLEEAAASDFDRENLLRHPYTRALWRAMPEHGFAVVSGSQPYVKDLPEGCPFGPRCPDKSPACAGEIPVRSVRGGRVRCVCPGEEEKRGEADGM